MFLWFALDANSQILPVDTAFNKKKFAAVIGLETAFYAGTATYLYTQWYSQYSTSGFHFFNDNKEWLQMDKVGHIGTSYYLGKFGYDMLRFAGVKKSKSIWWGGSFGALYLASVELMDGFSDKWGASSGDFIANLSGSAIFMIQQAVWDEQRIKLKLSYKPTIYAQYRPEALGSKFYESILKDYNGQTYWLSANISSFVDIPKFPKWLDLSLGYGADGMLGGYSNPQIIDGKAIPYFERNRQYYLSFDVDFSRMNIENQYLKTILELFSFVKFPMPALEFSDGKFHGHLLYP